MPRQPTRTGIRLENTTAKLMPAITLLKELNDAFGPPFIQPISNTLQMLIKAVQNVKRNKNDCAQLIENMHQVLYAIISFYIKPETAGSLPPAMLDNIGKFMGTLHKIYAFIEAQGDGIKIKHMFRSNEMQNLLKDCHVGLDQAMAVFRITATPAMFDDLGGMNETAKLIHEELLESIQTLSDASTSTDGSSSQMYLGVNDSRNRPKIFYGRESELVDIMKTLAQKSPRLAILGGGGMGKTSLAKAVLHHPDTSTKFANQFFVSAEPASTSIDLAALIGLHVGLNPGKDLTRPVVQYFSRKPGSLLILDNLETVWEPIESRGGVEEFLSLLTDVENFALIITMRGAERPAKVHWSHPFLLPLQPLPDEAAQQTFIDITDNIYAREDIKQLLRLTDNMPLAVDLIAHLSAYEGLSTVLERWETEKTMLLSAGPDRKSNLDVSISLSLSSPRITSNSKELLSLLSILPDGLSDADLVQSDLQILNILSCKAILLATSLAYQDGNKRLRSLMPVREHIRQFQPPSQSLVQRLCKHFNGLLELYHKYSGSVQLHPVVNPIMSNLGNLQQVLQQGLYDSGSNLTDTIHCTLYLNSFQRVTGHGNTQLMGSIQPLLHQLCDPQLEIHFIIEVLKSAQYEPALNPEQLLIRATTLIGHINNPLLESKFYHAAGNYFHNYGLDLSQAMLYFQKALQLSEMCGDIYGQGNALFGIAQLKYSIGDHHTAQVHAYKAQKLSKLSADLYQEAQCLWVGALCSANLGNFQQSMSQVHQGRAILAMCGMTGGSLDQKIILVQAENHLLKSEYGQARQIYTQIIETSSPDQNAISYTISLLNIAQIDVVIGGDPDDVHQKLTKAQEIFNQFDTIRGSVYCGTIQAHMDLKQENFDMAKAKFKECLHWAWGSDHEVESFCLERLADIKTWEGEQNNTWPVIYLGHVYKSKEKLGLHKAFLFLGDVFIFNGDEETATSLYTAALDGFTQMDVHHSRATCMIRLGDLAKGHGLILKATGLWKAARLLFEQSLQAKDLAQIDFRLSTVEEAHQKALLELGTVNAPGQVLNHLLKAVASPGTRI
ncbi:hypothetical protein DFH08DRAFT_807008 [Mycena albidolilacea]|uniref:Novel STAND NTPase 1 domain-containing protein n=1 Tax=Mycena albidolilacea TaxID=1033008 RepID=A0AAD7A503_9AGAR|nr:hypothetical protein DFH08DRAFT_807008 [Mycena albidolilacea]